MPPSANAGACWGGQASAGQARPQLQAWPAPGRFVAGGGGGGDNDHWETTYLSNCLFYNKNYSWLWAWTLKGRVLREAVADFVLTKWANRSLGLCCEEGWLCGGPSSVAQTSFACEATALPLRDAGDEAAAKENTGKDWEGVSVTGKLQGGAEQDAVLWATFQNTQVQSTCLCYIRHILTKTGANTIHTIPWSTESELWRPTEAVISRAQSPREQNLTGLWRGAVGEKQQSSPAKLAPDCCLSMLHRRPQPSLRFYQHQMCLDAAGECWHHKLWSSPHILPITWSDFRCMLFAYFREKVQLRSKRKAKRVWSIPAMKGRSDKTVV